MPIRFHARIATPGLTGGGSWLWLFLTRIETTLFRFLQRGIPLLLLDIDLVVGHMDEGREVSCVLGRLGFRFRLLCLCSPDRRFFQGQAVTRRQPLSRRERIVPFPGKGAFLGQFEQIVEANLLVRFESSGNWKPLELTCRSSL